jgi:hypothetical protein
MATSGLPARSEMFDLITGYWVSSAIATAARLEIADQLRDRPRTLAELAQTSNAHPEALYRLLRALASVGIFAEVGDQTFELTPLAQWLRSDIPGSLHMRALMDGAEWHLRPWAELLYSVKTGKSAFENLNRGEDVFSYLARTPDAAAVYYGVMTHSSQAAAQAVASSYDFSRYPKIIDVGGGLGALVAAILHAQPKATGVLFDQPSASDGARTFLREQGLTARCEVIAGDFRKNVPTGGDLYLLKHILHGWDDPSCIEILRRCREAMAPATRLLVIELLIPPGNQRSFAKLFDLEMLVLNGSARERTESEYGALLAQAGLSLRRAYPTTMPISILEAEVA